ncbi:MAG: nitroreductase family deazaflavin-dependent oxidoreductase [Chloroflexota bacterium]
MNSPKLPPAEERLRRSFKVLNKFMVFMFRIGLGWMINFWPAVVGRIMVIRHVGRKSGRALYVPVNYAVVDGEIYCMSGFGESHWYRNLVAHPEVELWLPRGRKEAIAEDVSDSPERAKIIRALVIASGFAAGAFGGINARKDSDERIAELTQPYRLLHFR